MTANHLGVVFEHAVRAMGPFTGRPWIAAKVESGSDQVCSDRASQEFR